MPTILNRLLAFVALLLLTGFTLASPAAAADGTAAPSVLLDTASWALLAGAVTPILTSVVQQPSWDPKVRTIVGLVVSVVVGVLTLLANGTLNDGPQTVLSVIAVVVVASLTAYKGLWQPLGVAPAIEGATSPSSPRNDRGAVDTLTTTKALGALICLTAIAGAALLLL